MSKNKEKDREQEREWIVPAVWLPLERFLSIVDLTRFARVCVAARTLVGRIPCVREALACCRMSPRAALEHIAGSDKIRLVEWMRGDAMPTLVGLMSRYGNTRLLRECFVRGFCEAADVARGLAARGDETGFREWIRERGTAVETKGLISFAARSGSFAMVETVARAQGYPENKALCPTKDYCWAAARLGQTEIVEREWEKESCPAHKLLIAACLGKHLGVVDFVLEAVAEEEGRLADMRAIEIARMGWRGRSIKIAAAAAKTGDAAFLDLIWRRLGLSLGQAGEEDFVRACAQAAAKHGHLALAYKMMNLARGPHETLRHWTQLMRDAARAGDLARLQAIHAYGAARDIRFAKGFELAGILFPSAQQSGNAELFAWILAQSSTRRFLRNFDVEWAAAVAKPPK